MSMNDPEWGRNAQGGGQNNPQPQQNDHDPRRPKDRQDAPPDLDALWNDFNNRLGKLFGKNGGGGGPKGPNDGDGLPNMPSAGKGFGVIVAVGVAVWLATGFHIVQEGSEGVVLQFGRYSHTEPPGFRWRLPYPIQSHEVVNSSQVRIIEVGYRNEVKSKVLKESLMLTEDENIIDIQFAVQYRLKNVGAYLFNTADPDETVKMAAETAIREVVGGKKMDYVLYEGREQIALGAQKLLQGILDRYNTGVFVSSITVQNVQPPEQVQASFDDAVKAGQDRERLKNDGQAYANDIIPRARGSAARLKEEAQGYGQRVVAQAEGDATRFKAVLTEYDKAPKVTKERMYIDTMQEIYSNVTKVLVDSKSNSQLLYLPLDKLIDKNASASGASSSYGASSAAAAAAKSEAALESNRLAPDVENNVRDALRNRERGVR
jgi:modulator of FtsH protease HflK